MPRRKYGLGQGLDALVSSRQRSRGWPEPELVNRHPDAPEAVPPEIVAWEYVCLTERHRRKKRKRRLKLQRSYPEINVRPRKQRLRGVSEWAALGMLGADGWELVAWRGRSFLLKRATPA